MVLRDELQRSALTGLCDAAQARNRKKEHREQKALGFGSSAERGLASRMRLRSGEEVPKVDLKPEHRRRRSSSCSGDGRKCVTPMVAEHSEASEKIKARIQSCLASRAGNGRSKHWKGEGPEKTMPPPKEVAEKPRGRHSQRSGSRSPKIAEIPKEGWGASSRSTSAGVSPQREPGVPPAALGPPVPSGQRLLGRTPSPQEGRPEPPPGGSNLLDVYRNIFEEIILLDHQYGATLRKVKSIYDSHLDGLEELRRENERLRAALAPGPGAWNPVRRASAPAIGPLVAPVAPVAPVAVVPAMAAPAQFHGAGPLVPKLNLQGIYPAN
eukprot:s693_g2.t1